MVTITQEGQLSAPLSNALFQNLKFWLSLTVPRRAALISDIKVNGGLIAKVERDADYCIYSQERSAILMTDRPMHSSTFVLDSIKRGRLEDPEKHLIDPSSILPQKHKSKPASSAARPKATRPHSIRKRNPFTTEEDLILLRTISQPGVPVAGNKIYHEMAEKYPSRTMHSWRGRWVDHFSKLNADPEWWYRKLLAGKKGKNLQQEKDDAEVDEEEEEGHEEEEEGGEEEEEEEPVKPTTEVIVARPKITPKSTLDRNKTKSLPSLGDDFTLQDDDILMAYHSTVVDAEDPLEVWEELGEKHPHHPASKWRKRYNTIILPRVQRGEVYNPQESTSKYQNPPPPSSPRLPSRRGHSHSLVQTSDARPRSSKSTPQPIPPARPSPSSSSVLHAVSSPPEHGAASRWHAAVPGLTSVPATDAPTVASPQSDTGTTKPNKRKRIPPTPSRFSRSTEIPSTPECDHRQKQQRRREPSPELGSPILLPPIRSGDLRSSSPLDRDEPSTGPPSPSSPSNPNSSPLYKSHSSSPYLGQKTPSPPSMTTRVAFSPIPISNSPENQLDASLMIPPLASPAPSRSLSASPSLFSSSSSEEPESEAETLPDFVKRMKTRFPGLTSPRIAWALKRTSADKNLAEVVIAAHMRGEGLPVMRGVWSEEEDAVLVGRDSRAIQSLVEDREEWEHRLKFLEEWERSKPDTRRSTV